MSLKNNVMWPGSSQPLTIVIVKLVDLIILLLLDFSEINLNSVMSIASNVILIDSILSHFLLLETVKCHLRNKTSSSSTTNSWLWETNRVDHQG